MIEKNQPARQVSGTREWAVETVNFCNGCCNSCIYCYARYRAVHRLHRMTNDDWPKELVRDHDVRKSRRLVNGPVMCPSTHDITPGNIEAAETVLLKLLDAGNQLLIVSKPREECIDRLTKSLLPYLDQVLFRFTIGVVDERLRRFWEPEAPTFEERLNALQMAHEAGYATSVSAEPLLEPWNASELLARLRPFITHSFWIGKLNQLHGRTKWLYPDGHPEIDRLEQWQTDEKVFEVYEALKHDPLVRWKESYKMVLGLELSTTAGLDI